MKAVRAIFKTIKGLYDIVGTYLVAGIVPFATAAFGLYAITLAVSLHFGFDDIESMWNVVSQKVGVNSLWIRLGVYLPVHAVLFRILRRPMAALKPKLETLATKLIEGFNYLTKYFPWGRATGEVIFTLALTLAFVPFFVQPTLVRGYLSATPWLERIANLADGTASATAADSIIGLYRKFYAQPVVVEGVAKDQLDKAFNNANNTASGPLVAPKPSGNEPMMDRWDPYIEKVAKGDAAKFAYIKAFMWTESGGRQYAVSHTGCSGLMQFCTGTARSEPYRSVFGRGTVYKCQCNGSCRIPKATQKALESGDPDELDRHKKNFPCEMTDTRFNPAKAIEAGGVYIDNLRNSFGGNIYLMYIGYNSGPRVAAKVWRKTGENPDVTLSEIDQHLADALRASFPGSADRRARSLVRTHLPKIAGAYKAYYAPDGELAMFTSIPQIRL